MSLNFLLMSWMALILAYLLTRLAEYRIHRVNYDFLIFAGGEEILAKRMRIFYFVGFLAIPLTFVDYYWRVKGGHSAVVVPTSLQMSGLALILGALVLRLWAMRSLGHRWSMRCVFVSGYPRTASGPYKFINHPEYLSRYCEGIGFCLYLGSLLAAGVFTLVFWLAARAVVAWELRQLRALSVDLRESIR